MGAGVREGDLLSKSPHLGLVVRNQVGGKHIRRVNGIGVGGGGLLN